jgi:hypothetical protein
MLYALFFPRLKKKNYFVHRQLSSIGRMLTCPGIQENGAVGAVCRDERCVST